MCVFHADTPALHGGNAKGNPIILTIIRDLEKKSVSNGSTEVKCIDVSA